METSNIVQGTSVNVQELTTYNNYKHHNIANADTVANQVLSKNNASPTMDFSRDINDTFSKSQQFDIAVEIKAISMTNILAFNFRNIDDGIHTVSNALAIKANGSIFEMAKIFEEESALLRGLVNITEDERASRLHLLERGFADAAYWNFFGQTCSLRNMDSLVNYATNAALNIDITGLKDETKNLLFEGLSKAVKATFHDIVNASLIPEMFRPKNGNKIIKITLTDEQKRYRTELFEKYIEALKKLDWLSIGEFKTGILRNELLNIINAVKSSEENDNVEDTPEVSDTDDPHEKTLPDNTPEGE
jgi:hypothetical protein